LPASPPIINHFVTGYFRGFEDSNAPNAELIAPSMTNDRSISVFPEGATLEKATFSTGGIFAYPDAPVSGVNQGCSGNFSTGAMLLFDADDILLNDQQTVILLEQMSSFNGAFKIVMTREDPLGYRIVASDKNGQNAKSTTYFPVPPKFIYIGLQEQGSDMVANSPNQEYIPPGTTFSVKVNGEYLTWTDQDPQNEYVSGLVPSPRYSRFMHYVGQIQNQYQDSSPFSLQSVNRKFMPLSTTPLTKLIAGDDYFCALYKDAVDNKDKIRGSLVRSSASTDYVFTAFFGYSFDVTSSAIETNIGNYGQGPFLKNVQDIVGPKNHFLSKVRRTYKKATALTPSDSIYTSDSLDLTTVRYGYQSEIKIYVGDKDSDSNTVMDYNYNHNFEDPRIISGQQSNLRVWPKVVFPSDDEYNDTSKTVYPHQISIYRNGFRIAGPPEYQYPNNNTFTVDTYYPYSDGTPFDTFPVARNVNQYSSVLDLTSIDTIICYDYRTRRLLPQTYYPTDNLSGNLTNISLGVEHTVANTYDNSLVSLGSNLNGQRAFIKTLIDEDTPVLKVVTNGYTTLVLKTNNTLVGKGNDFLPLPENIPLLKDVAIGGIIAVGIRVDNDELYVWGAFTSAVIPPGLGPCKKIACGYDFAAVITANDRVVVFGNTGYGRGNIPSALQSGIVTEVACTYSRVAARLNTGIVYWWGTVDSNGNPLLSGNTTTTTNQIGSTKDHFFVVNATTNRIIVPLSNQPSPTWDLNLTPSNTQGTWVLGRGINANHMVASNGTDTYGWGSNYKPEVSSPGPGEEIQWTGQAFIVEPSYRIAVKVNPFNLIDDGPYNHVVVSTPSSTSTYTHAQAIPNSIRAKNEDFVYTSTELDNLQHVISMASAYDVYFAVVGDTIDATQGSLLVWGQNIPSQLSNFPESVDGSANITKVSFRKSHVAALNSSGTAYVWGQSSSGAIPLSGSITNLLDIECGDNMTVGIKTDHKLVSFGRYNGSSSGSDFLIPAPFNSMKFSSISCGIDHVVGKLSETYSEAVAGGLFIATAGSAVSFGQNTVRQTELPGFKYTNDNISIVGDAVAGGKFTAFITESNGFNCFVPNNAQVNKGVMFINKKFHEDLSEDPAENVFDSELIEGYMAHTSGYLCDQILPPTHSFYFNRPTTVRTPGGDLYYSINCFSAYTKDLSRKTNAIDIPASYRRNGSKKAKHIATGRFKQWVYDTGDHMFGAGYTIIVDKDTNAIEVVGGELIPNSCSDNNYPVPPHTIGIRTVPGDELKDAVITQVGTYRSYVYALKSLGQIVSWGYQDYASLNSSVTYQINDNLRQYFSLPDVSMFDYTDKAKFNVPNEDNSLIGMSYIAGIPGVSNYWAVVVSLDRYFNGVKTNIRKFVATGDATVTEIVKPVHFAETFLCVDTWPSGTATGLDTQYVMSVTPYSGVSCEINSASLFGMNLDSRLISGQKILLQPSDISNNSIAADYALSLIDNTQLDLESSVSLGTATVLSISEGSDSVALTTTNSVLYPSYLKGRFEGTARTERPFTAGFGAHTAGRISQAVNWTPGSTNGDIALPLAWYKSTSLPSANSVVNEWNSSGSGSTQGTQLKSTANPRKPLSVTFNTSYRGAQFDKDPNQEDDLVSSTLFLNNSGFTYFVVYNKTVYQSSYNLAFGKTYVATGGTGGNRVSGFGFHYGRPVLYYDFKRYTATSTAQVTGNNIACAYYGSSAYNGIRINGAQIEMGLSENNVISTDAFSTKYNMSRPVVGFVSGTSTTYSHVDNNDIYAEVLAFEQILTLPQIQIVEGYLADKFNMRANLPDNHPYKFLTLGQDLLQVLTLPLLSENNLLSFESDKFTETSGLAQSWVGLFDVTVSHKGERMETSTKLANHHAPVLAEFDVKLNQTSTIFVKVISCNFAVGGSLFVDNSIKQLFGSSAFKLNTVAPQLKTTFTTIPIIFKTFISPINMLRIVRMSANIDLKFKLSGANDCNTIYGCNGVSEFPPELYLIYRTYDPQNILTRLDVSANLAKLVIVDYVTLSCRFAAAGTISQIIGFKATASAIFKVEEIPLNKFKSSTVNLGYAKINGITSAFKMCLSNVQILGASEVKYPNPGPGTINPTIPSSEHL
jgi:alpha-tubulin suppressor-like RCC1 family protein